MAKLLPTRIPLAGDEVTPELFNRLVRVLELNLGQFDPNRTPQFTDSEISELNFVAGDIIFNLTREIHQAYDGTEFRDLYSHQTYPVGVSGTGAVGSVTVTTS
jgi:hypothetical protein|tara:strand:- start:1433 stop:1741 length:309 start_codon:yes stop_codon:yes gene_type:complete